MLKLVLSIVLMAAIQVPPPAPPFQQPIVPRDDARPVAAREGTAIIRGRVTDQETGLPVARARVMLMSSAITRPPGSGPLQVQTSKDGGYEFRDLPAGDYTVMVQPGEFRATYLPHAFGQDRPTDLSRPRRPRPLTLAEGEVRENINVALWRAFAIELHVAALR